MGPMVQGSYGVLVSRYHVSCNIAIKIESGILHRLYLHGRTPLSLLIPRDSCRPSGRCLLSLGTYFGRRSLGDRPPGPRLRRALALRIVTGIAWIILLLGGRSFFCRGSARACRKLRLLRQRAILRGGLGWNGGFIIFLFNSLDTFPSSRLFESRSRLGLIVTWDRSVPCSPPGGRSRVRRGVRFLG